MKCARCEKKQRRRGSTLCWNCQQVLLREMTETGYLEPIEDDSIMSRRPKDGEFDGNWDNAVRVLEG